MYIRSSPRGPNRDPNRTLSNKLLLIKALITSYNKEALGSIKAPSLSRLIKSLIAIN